MNDALYSYYCGIMTFGKGWKRLVRLTTERERERERERPSGSQRVRPPPPSSLRRLLLYNTLASLPLFLPFFLPDSFPGFPFLLSYLAVLWYQSRLMRRMVGWLEERREASTSTKGGVSARRGSETNSTSSSSSTSSTLPLSAKVSTAAYSALLYLLLGLQTTLLPTLLPHPLSLLAYALLTAWLYAFYAYDATWSAAAYPLSAKMAVFEKDYLFFAGFGTPFAVTVCVTSLHPVTAYALASLLFPLSLSASFGSPRVEGIVRGRFGVAPIFAVPKRVLGVIGRAATGGGVRSHHPSIDTHTPPSLSLSPSLCLSLPLSASLSLSLFLTHEVPP
jgi:hypothetical protein